MVDTSELNRFSQTHGTADDQRRGERRGRVQGRSLLRPQRSPRPRAGHPDRASSRPPRSSAGRPAPVPARSRSPRRWPSASWWRGRRRSCAPTRSSPSFIAGLEAALSPRGHALLLQVAEQADHAAYRRLVQEGRVDGVFVTDLQVDDARPALLEELGLPAVIIGPDLGEQQRERQSALGVDDAPGIRAAVEHLVELGPPRHRARRRPAAHGARPVAPPRLGRGTRATPGCRRAPASRPTSPPSRARVRWTPCSLRSRARPPWCSPTT